MTMLSPDVLGQVEAMRQQNPRLLEGWESWIEKAQQKIAAKRWYETNVANLLYLAD